MPTFRYKARTSSGEMADGTVQAATEDAALDKLSEEGCFPLSIEPAPGEDPGETAAPDRRPSAGRDAHTSVHYLIRGDTHLLSSEQLLKSDTRVSFRQVVATQDIGAGGASFDSDRPIKKGAILSIRIELPDGGEPIECVARAEKSEEIETGEVYRISTSYLNMSADDRARIDAHVRNKR